MLQRPPPSPSLEEVKARGKKMLQGLRLVELQNTGEDEALLKQFYDEMMPSNFPLDDERESYESMLAGLKHEDDTTWYRYSARHSMSREKPCRVGYHVARTARPGHFLQICACARRLASPGGHRRRGLFRVLHRPLARSLAAAVYLAQWALAHRRYYIGCNCSLVSYIITADGYRGCGLSRKSAVES